jgi:hypothetical protein
MKRWKDEYRNGCGFLLCMSVLSQGLWDFFRNGVVSRSHSGCFPFIASRLSLTNVLSDEARVGLGSEGLYVPLGGVYGGFVCCSDWIGNEFEPSMHFLTPLAHLSSTFEDRTAQLKYWKIRPAYYLLSIDQMPKPLGLMQVCDPQMLMISVPRA